MCNFSLHLCVGSSFVGWHPTRIRRSFLPSFRPPRPFLSHALTHLCFTSLTHSLTQHKISPLTHSLHSFTHSTQDLLHITHSLTQHKISPLTPLTHSLNTRSASLHSTPLISTPLHSTHLISTPLHSTHSTPRTPLHFTPLHSLSHSLTHSLHALSPLSHSQHPERSEGPAARVVAAGPPVVAAGPPSLSAVAGAVARASRRGCGAHCRRRAPLTLCKGRRSTQSLQKGLLRALSPLGPPRSLQWQAQSAPRASRRGCGARCRRAPCGSVRDCHCDLQSNCHCDFHSSIDSCRFAKRMFAARVVAAGPPAALCVVAILICFERASGQELRLGSAGPILKEV